MNINWKIIAQSPGYKSLQAKYVEDVQAANSKRQLGRRPMRDKEEFRKQFNKIINRAINHAYHLNTTVDAILNEWESKRTCWWMNYNLPSPLGRDHPCVKPPTKKYWWRQEKARYSKRRKKQMYARRAQLLGTESKREKPRWRKRDKELQQQYGRGWLKRSL